MRPFLAFDTATDHLAIGIGDLDDPLVVLGAEDFPAPRAANTVLLSAIARVLESIGLAPADLAAVACGRGPGSFTGVRIGVATAKGLAHGRELPLIGFGTLDAVAFRVSAARMTDDRALIGVLGDAMRGEVYPALFRVCEGGAVRIGADRVALPGEVAAEWAGLDEPLLLAGNGLTKHAGAFDAAEGALMAERRLWSPDGASLVAAAWASEGGCTLRAIAGLGAPDAYRCAHPATLLPVYTRLSDAEEAERTRGSAVTPRNGVAGPWDGEPR